MLPMALVDLDKLSPAGLIAQFVVECRNAGPILPYMDYEVIDEWLTAAPDADQLLLVLADALPEFFDPEKRRTSKPRSLKGARRKILKRLGGGRAGACSTDSEFDPK
jgi:hypothetical protein